MVLRLNLASEFAKRRGETLLSRRFALEAELLQLKPKQEDFQRGATDKVADIWFRNLEAEMLSLLREEEPFSSFLAGFSPEFAKEVAGRGWLDACAFWNFKLLAKQYTGEEEFNDPLLWAVFRMIPSEEFKGRRRGTLPSAEFSTRDRFDLEAIVSKYSSSK